jgi:1-deoxy-D-xylulose-5-phosphate synthase
MTQHLARRGMPDGGLKIRPMTQPGRFADRNSRPTQYDEAGLDATHIVETAPVALGNAVTSSKPSLARTN